MDPRIRQESLFSLVRDVDAEEISVQAARRQLMTSVGRFSYARS